MVDQHKFVNKVQEADTQTYVVQHSFSDFEIDARIKSNIAHKGYTTPTPIQDQAITPALEGRDVIGIANTGTGKTAAFLIPLIHKVIQKPSERVLIVTPTRVLAHQIVDELKSFTHSLRIYTTLCIGGTSMLNQKKNLERDPHFVIGTPGRLKDFIQQRSLNLSRFHSIVLDEVDRMVDIGFIKDIRYLISLLPQQRQSLFFSATISEEVKSILDSFVYDPVTISVKTRDTLENIDQDIVKRAGRNKVDVLKEYLQKEGFEKVLVFCRTKWGAQKLSQLLLKEGLQLLLFMEIKCKDSDSVH